MNRNKPILALTMGDAAGIGPEIIVKAFEDQDTAKCANQEWTVC